MKTVQRSPDLGIGIRLQRLAPVSTPGAVTPSTPPGTPYWWGWDDEKHKHTSALERLWNDASTPAYFPGAWVAVVEGATSVTWTTEFVPTVWFISTGETVAKIVWQGDPVVSHLPPTGALVTPEVLFAAVLTPLPDPLSTGEGDIAYTAYWAGADPASPLLIADGNTLTVVADSIPVTGILTAKASVGGVSVGVVTLTLKRATSVLPPVTEDVAILISDASVSIYGPTLTHTVTLSKSFVTAQTYSFELAGTTAVDGVDFEGTLTNADFTEGVTLSGGEVTVPAGVTSFDVVVTTIFHPNGSFVEYQILMPMTIGGVSGFARGIGKIFDI